MVTSVATNDCTAFTAHANEQSVRRIVSNGLDVATSQYSSGEPSN